MERAERIGMRPVMKEARPAVQLACPYQDVNIAPSRAMRSTLGVGWPSALPPPEYAPKSFHPISSPISMMMFGLFSAAAGPASKAAIKARSALLARMLAKYLNLR